MGREGFTGAFGYNCAYEKEGGNGHKESTSFVTEKEDADCEALYTSGWKGDEVAEKRVRPGVQLPGFDPGSQLGNLDK